MAAAFLKRFFNQIFVSASKYFLRNITNGHKRAGIFPALLRCSFLLRNPAFLLFNKFKLSMYRYQSGNGKPNKTNDQGSLDFSKYFRYAFYKKRIDESREYGDYGKGSLSRFPREMTQNILVRLSASPKGTPMCVWRNRKLAPANRRRIERLRWHRRLMFPRRRLMYPTLTVRSALCTPSLPLKMCMG